MLASQHKHSSPRPSVSPRLGYELAVRAVEYLRLHELADALWSERERLSRMVGGTHAPAPAPSVGAAGTTLAAELELATIENSRFFALVRSAKNNIAYRLVARMRWGPSWEKVDPNEQASQRLARIKSSRAYRLVQRIKSTGLYRVYALRKYGGLPPGPAPVQSHTSGVSSLKDRT